ncbi:MAG TPA: type II secretion system protein [Kofleriaceae bacterium]|nr:type II secretion system protein [Kofleriaceae bacterium]
MSRARERQRGFTLIEVMIVVAVIGVLVAIAVPVFSGSSRKAKGISEVAPYFQDFRTRMDQYQQENGVYPATIGEGTFHPATPGARKQTILPLPATWTALRLRISGSTDVYCGYTWATGLANDQANIGPIAAAAPPAGFGFTAPATNWYYLLAKCNLDGTGGSSYYFTSSVDTSIRKLNEGN